MSEHDAWPTPHELHDLDDLYCEIDRDTLIDFDPEQASKQAIKSIEESREQAARAVVAYIVALLQAEQYSVANAQFGEATRLNSEFNAKRALARLAKLDGPAFGPEIGRTHAAARTAVHDLLDAYRRGAARRAW